MEAGVRIFGGLSRWSSLSNHVVFGIKPSVTRMNRCCRQCIRNSFLNQISTIRTITFPLTFALDSLPKSHRRFISTEQRSTEEEFHVRQNASQFQRRSSANCEDSFTSANRPLSNQTWRQFLTSDEKTIVCVHPMKPVEISDTKPLRSLQPWVKRQRTSLTEDEIKIVRRLRNEDGSLWTVNTLARYFNVKRAVISKVAPANVERQAQITEEKALISKLKPYKRKLLRTQRQMERQKKLESVIAQNRELSNLREKYHSQT